MRRARIVATLGPASSSPDIIEELIRAGMSVARLNFSHGNHETHLKALKNIREISKKLKVPVAVLQDLQGVKIRTGTLKDRNPVKLSEGDQFVITTSKVEGNASIVSTSYSDLPRDVRPDDRILLSDGLIELVVESISETEVICRVVSGGLLRENQGVNIPGAEITAPALTEKDLEDLEFGIQNKVDYIALSFVRRPEDVLQLKEKLAEKKADIPIIAKLEKPSAIESLDSILDVCEGVMVARGDLGVEMSPEKVPIIQKKVIWSANRKNRLVITATQMLESMIHNPRPTRAEASDVANAVFDGTDALMLSGETAAGEHPVEAVRMMAKIIDQAELMPAEYRPPRTERGRVLEFPEAVCDAAYHASKAIHARAIVAFTQSGSTARLISKYRPDTDIFAFTPSQRIVSRMCLYWGVHPIRMREISNVDELIEESEKMLLKLQLVRPGDNLIILTGAPIMEKGHTSLMKLHSVKDPNP